MFYLLILTRIEGWGSTTYRLYHDSNNAINKAKEIIKRNEPEFNEEANRFFERHNIFYFNKENSNHLESVEIQTVSLKD